MRIYWRTSSPQRWPGWDGIDIESLAKRIAARAFRMRSNQEIVEYTALEELSATVLLDNNSVESALAALREKYPKGFCERGVREMAKFRKKPVEITAEQYHMNAGPLRDGVCLCLEMPMGPHLHTMHKGQQVELQDGDWIIPESDGVHFYPCKPDVFAATYEPVED